MVRYGVGMKINKEKEHRAKEYYTNSELSEK